MINSLFPVFNVIDAMFAPWCSLAMRIVAWGAIAGIGFMGLYRLVSDQDGIAGLKNESRKARRRMMAKDIEYSEFTALARRNLVMSLSLLGKTLLPTVVASTAVLVVLCWVAAYHTYDWGGDTAAVNFDVRPAVDDLTLSPPAAFRREGGNIVLVRTRQPGQIELAREGRIAYRGSIASPPTRHVQKREWWNIFLGNVAGYIEPQSKLERIEADFPRKIIVSGVPSWMGTWEAPFFLAVAVFALGIKFIFRIG